MASRARAHTEVPSHVGSRAGVVELPTVPRNRPLAPRGGAAAAETTAKRHEVLGLVTLAAGVLLALAVGSYDARGGADWCGPIGAAVAESLVALLGTASVLVPWVLLVLSVKLFRRTERPVQFVRALGTAAIVAVIATALHLAFGERPLLGHLPAGGLLGISVGELLRSLLGTAGAHVVVLTALLVALVIRTRLSVVSVASNARKAGVRSSLVAREGIVTVARAWQQARDEEARARGEGVEGAEARIVAPEERTASALAEVFARAESEGLGYEEDEESGDGAGEGRSAGALDSQPGQTRAGLDALFASEEAPAKAAPRPRRAKKSAPPGEGAPSEAPQAEGAAADAAPAVAVPERESETPSVVIPLKRERASRRPARMAQAGGGELVEVAPPPLPAVTAPVAEELEPEEVPAPSTQAVPPLTAREPAVRPSVVRPPVAREVAAREVAAREPEPAPEAPLAEPLQIVSHDEEIEAAMRDAAASSSVVPPAAKESARPAAPAAPQRVFAMPSTELLSAAPRDGVQFDETQLRAAADRLIKTLKDYTIDGRVVEIHPGPVVTTYEFVPAAGTKLAKIARLSDDIAMSLEANKVRIVAPIPGKGRVGFEIPNTKRQTVYFRELVETPAFQALGGALPVAFGKDVVGAPFFADLAAMPHLIVAGATGAGKSVGLNVMLTSLLYKRGPEDVRLLMIDPKMVELAVYDGIPHMLLPVVTDMKKASLALRWVVDEMERRYTLFAQTGARNITTYNERVAKALSEGKTLKGLAGPVRTKETGTTMELPPEGAEGAQPVDDSPKPSKLPYILVVVDEFADLMMVAGKEVEAAVARLAQKARAAGIHVILATQRPSVDVITGVIKANFPSRVAFKVSQKVDSRTILDQQGAEHLLGRGDMLILPPGSSDLRRVHCAFVSEDEVQSVTDHWRKQGAPTYDEDILRPRDEDEEAGADEPEIRVPLDKYEKAVALVLSSRRCSVSWVQRQLAVGYNVAARMVEKMERDGIVGAPKGPGKDREVLG